MHHLMKHHSGKEPPHIICLQETCKLKSDINKRNTDLTQYMHKMGYTQATASNHKKKRTTGHGLVTYVHRSLYNDHDNKQWRRARNRRNKERLTRGETPHEGVPKHLWKQQGIVINELILLGKRTTIINAYQSPSHGVDTLIQINKIIEHLRATDNQHFLILGDLNAHHPTWEAYANKKANARGTYLRHMMNTHDMRFISEINEPTHLDPAPGSTIDFIIAHNSRCARSETGQRRTGIPST